LVCWYFGCWNCGCWYISMLVCKNVDVLQVSQQRLSPVLCRYFGCWFIGMLVYWYAGILVYWHICMLVCWYVKTLIYCRCLSNVSPHSCVGILDVGILVRWHVGMLVCENVDTGVPRSNAGVAAHRRTPCRSARRLSQLVPPGLPPLPKNKYLSNL